MDKVTAVIVTYNGIGWIERCLNSLLDSKVKIHMIIVDNGSKDGTLEIIKNNYSDVILIETGQNLGFAKANNIGIKKALEIGSDYVFLLNQDAWIEEDTISEMLKAFKLDEKVGLVSPIHLNGSYTALDADFALYMSAKFISDSFLKQTDDFYDVPMVNAAAWLLSRECIEKVGGFDTLLFVHYGEDDNYCQRVLYHGFKIKVCTKSTICHDREYREDYSLRTSFGLSNDDRYRRITLGDINLNSDLLENIVTLEKRIKKNKHYFRSSRNTVLEKEISFLKLVYESREQNKKAGPNWLN